MGRATITANQGGGLYSVNLEYDRTAADQRLLGLTSEAAIWSGRVTGRDATLTAAIARQAAATASLTAAIQALAAARGTGDQAQIDAATAVVQAAERALLLTEKDVITAAASLNEARLHLAALQRSITTLQGRLVAAAQPASLYCADYTDGLAVGATVGTIEVGRRGSRTRVIRPGGDFDATRDGLVHQTMTISPAAAFHAYALLPGAGRWRPRYRTGEITAIDATAATASVDLDATVSTHQLLDLNAASSLSDVPFEYMDTQGPDPFTVGDRVVVEFRDTGTPATAWDHPVIIGYDAEPRPLVGNDWFFDGAVIMETRGVAPLTWHVEFGGAYGPTVSVPGTLSWPLWPPGDPSISARPEAVLTLTTSGTGRRILHATWPMWPDPFPNGNLVAPYCSIFFIYLVAVDANGDEWTQRIYWPHILATAEHYHYVGLPTFSGDWEIMPGSVGQYAYKWNNGTVETIRAWPLASQQEVYVDYDCVTDPTLVMP